MAAVMHSALCSHPGMVRDMNEDAVGVDDEVGLAVLADGLGGYNAGEVAAAIAVSRTLAGLQDDWKRSAEEEEPSEPDELLTRRLQLINAEIVNASIDRPENRGMATTIVVAWLLGDSLWIAHAGDSRAYRFRANVLEPLTRDHSYVQDLIEAGILAAEHARQFPEKNLVTRALGAKSYVEPEISRFALGDGDWLLLCSDGLTEMVTDSDIAAELANALPDAGRAAQRLIDKANAAGGNDNISVILLRRSAST